MTFPAPNYTQTPNGLLDDVLPVIDSLGELKVTLVVARQTLGWHRERAALTLTAIQKLSGLSRSAASRGIQMALERGTIRRHRHLASDGYVYELAIGGSSELPETGASSSPELPETGASSSELPLTGSSELPPYARAGSAVKEREKETPLPPPDRGEEIDVPVQRRLIDDEPVPLLSERGLVESVWEHYVEARQRSSKKMRRTELDPETRRMIAAALKVATHVELKQAINGLFLSEHHTGRNDRGKTYLGPEYVFKGHSGKTTRSQVEMFLEIAESAGVTGGGSSVDHARLAQAKRTVLDAWEFPGDREAQKAGDMSAAWLAQHGYRVERAEGGRPTFIEEAQ